MPNPYPTALRERAVRAYKGSAETYTKVAARFSVHINTLVRWVQGVRDRGTVLPAARGGGWCSPVDIPLLHALIKERPDRTTEELTRALASAPHPRRRSIARACCEHCSGRDTSSKKTAATGGARQSDSPGGASRLPRLDGPRRCAPLGLSR